MIQQIKYFIYYLTKFQEFRCVIIRGCVVILRNSIETTDDEQNDKIKIKRLVALLVYSIKYLIYHVTKLY